MNDRARIATALLALRLGVALVMFVWTLDKFVNVAHASRVYENFYGIGGLGSGAMAVIGAAELLLVLAFLAGYQKRISYGTVLILHGISTLSSYRQYMAPFENLLFFAAWPMLAACYALYVLRNEDVLLTIRGAIQRIGEQPKQSA